MSFGKEMLALLSVNHPELNNSGFAHLINIGGLQTHTPFRIADDLQIRRAHPNEMDTLKSLLPVTFPFNPLTPVRNPYETLIQGIETRPGNISYTTRDLPNDEWRYHVVEFKGTNARLLDFVDASVLTSSRLELGPTVLACEWLHGPSFLSGGSVASELWNELRFSDEALRPLTKADLDDLRIVFEKVSVFKDDRVALRDSMKRFQQLDAVPKASPLRFLGYVAVLESLITHAPDPKDPYDSLTRQVRQKMLLLERRLVIPLEYELFAGNASHEKVWTKLYEYRSSIAHGGVPDFGGRFRILKDNITALRFISSATVAVMRQALEEPDLVADLRAC